MTRDEYLQILFDDLGFDRTQRNAWLTRTLQREIKYLDALTGPEQSQLIDVLKEMKADRKSAAWVEEGE